MNRRTVTSMFGFAVCGAVLVAGWVSALADAQEVAGDKYTTSDIQLLGTILSTNLGSITTSVGGLPAKSVTTNQVDLVNPETGSTNVVEKPEKKEEPPSAPSNLRIVLTP